jgi:SAM-dependent methyltransferase
MALNPQLKSFAERILPERVLARLDPVKDLIDAEVRQASDRLKEGQVVLDAGAGEARHRMYFPKARYIALDAGYGDRTWDYSKLDICGDLETLPLRNASIDCVLCMVVLEHTRNPRRVLLEFARVLKPGGMLLMVVPFLWEEHQQPHDYFRFTRYGVRALFEPSSLRLDQVDPIGGFFWVCARRSIALLNFFQSGWRWIFFPFLAPLFGFLLPLVLYSLDGLDREKYYSLGLRVRAHKME